MTKMKLRITFAALFLLMLSPRIYYSIQVFRCNKTTSAILSLPDSTKLEYIRSANYKKLNVNTINDFDNYWKHNLANMNFYYYLFCFQLIILIGLLSFNRFALYAFYILFILLFLGDISWFLSPARLKQISIFNKVFSAAAELICLIYFSHKKTRNAFSKSSKSPSNILLSGDEERVLKSK